MKSKLRILLVVVATVVLLALFLRNSDPRQIWALIRSTDLLWLMVGFLVNIGALVCRTERWRWILNSKQPPPFYATFFSTSLGFMTSAILPIRAADVIRPALLSRRTKIRFSSALGTVAIERLLDLIAILSMFVTFVFTRSDSFAVDAATRARWSAVHLAGVVSAATVIAVIVMLVSMYFWSPRVRLFHAWLGKALPVRFREGWMHFFDAFVASLSIVHDRAAFARIVLLTGGVWLCLSSQFYFATLATRHPLPFTVSFFLTGITIVGLMIPTPGGVGGFHKACQIALTGFYGFDVNSSIAVAVIFHIIGTLPIIIVGTILLWRERVGLGQILKLREHPDDKVES